MSKFVMIVVWFSVFNGSSWETQVEQGSGVVNESCHEIIQNVRSYFGDVEGARFEAADCSEVEFE